MSGLTKKMDEFVSAETETRKDHAGIIIRLNVAPSPPRVSLGSVEKYRNNDEYLVVPLPDGLTFAGLGRIERFAAGLARTIGEAHRSGDSEKETSALKKLSSLLTKAKSEQDRFSLEP